MKKVCVISLIFILIISVLQISFATSNDNQNELNLEGIKTIDVTDFVAEENFEDYGDYSEVLDNDYFDFDDEIITLESTKISGNAFVISQDVQISNTYIDGDLYVIGKNVVLENVTIKNSIYVCGGTISLYGIEANSIYNASEMLYLQENSNILRNVYEVSDEFIVNSSKVNKNLYVSAQNIQISSDSSILGDFTYSSENEASIDDNVVKGEVEFQEQEKEEVKEESTKKTTFVNLISNLIFGLVIIAVYYKLKKNSFSNIQENIGSVIVYAMYGIVFGLAELIISSLLIIFGIFTFGGVSALGLLNLALLALGVVISIPVSSFLFANCMLNIDNKKDLFKYALIIYVCYSVLNIIPSLGTILSFICGLCGFGYIIKNRIDNLKETKEENESVNINNGTAKEITSKNDTFNDNNF